MTALAAASQTKAQTEDLYLKKIYQINTLLPLLLEAGRRAGGQPGPRQQAVLHPDGAVQGGDVSPLLARAVTVLFSLDLPREIFLRLLQKLHLAFHWRVLLVISCDVNK